MRWAVVLNVVGQELGDDRVEHGRERAALTNTSSEVEWRAHFAVQLNTAVGVVVECGDKVDGSGGEADGGEDFEEVVLGYGWKGR